jgi:hypothetical protein
MRLKYAVEFTRKHRLSGDSTDNSMKLHWRLYCIYMSRTSTALAWMDWGNPRSASVRMTDVYYRVVTTESRPGNQLVWITFIVVLLSLFSEIPRLGHESCLRNPFQFTIRCTIGCCIYWQCRKMNHTDRPWFERGISGIQVGSVTASATLLGQQWHVFVPNRINRCRGTYTH